MASALPPAAAQFDVTGMELVTYTDAGRDDNLVVDTSLAGADNIRVEEQVAGITARVSSENMPNIDFTNVAVFQLETPLAPPPVFSDLGAEPFPACD